MFNAHCISLDDIWLNAIWLNVIWLNVIWLNVIWLNVICNDDARLDDARTEKILLLNLSSDWMKFFYVAAEIFPGLIFRRSPKLVCSSDRKKILFAAGS